MWFNRSRITVAFLRNVALGKQLILLFNPLNVGIIYTTAPPVVTEYCNIYTTSLVLITGKKIYQSALLHLPTPKLYILVFLTYTKTEV